VRPSYTFWFWFWLAIVGIALLYPRIRVHEKSHIGNYVDRLGGIKSVLGQFQVDNGFYPKSLQDLFQKPDAAKNWHGPYLESTGQLVDPWGNKFIYECPGRHNTNSYDLFSAGPDGRIGTEDDIVNWQK
jgi:general secretion pathway protein G